MSSARNSESVLEAADAPAVDAAFVILLERDAKRRDNVHAALGHIGLDFEIFPAVDGLKLTAAEVGRLVRRGRLAADCARHMTRGQVACALSHIAVLEQVAPRGCRSALVLEDDFDPAPGFSSRLRETLRAVPPDFDLLYLYDGNLENARALPGRPGLRASAYPLGTVGYAVSARGVGRILELIQPVDDHLDEVLARQVDAGRIRAYSATPSIVTFRKGFVSQVDHSGYLEPGEA